jgi:hypothetical protein
MPLPAPEQIEKARLAVQQAKAFQDWEPPVAVAPPPAPAPNGQVDG